LFYYVTAALTCGAVTGGLPPTAIVPTVFGVSGALAVRAGVVESASIAIVTRGRAVSACVTGLRQFIAGIGCAHISIFAIQVRMNTSQFRVTAIDGTPHPVIAVYIRELTRVERFITVILRTQRPVVTISKLSDTAFSQATVVNGTIISIGATWEFTGTRRGTGVRGEIGARLCPGATAARGHDGADTRLTRSFFTSTPGLGIAAIRQ